MSPLVRSVTALALVISLSCAGPLEEAGGVRFAPDEAETPGTAALTLERVRGEPPLEVSNLEVARTLRILAPQLERVARDPDLARRRMLAAEPPPELEGLLLDGAVRGRIVLASAELTGAQREALTHAYLRHCQETHGRAGDCLNVMNGEQSLGQGARYRLACHFALASVWEGMAEELGDMVDLDRLASAVIFGFASWAVLAVVPEPISKILAAGLTVVMAAWLGVDALLNVIGGWMEMAVAADQATTLPELMRAGRAYGERMGRQTVRLMVMLVASFIADKGVANLPKLPKFNLAMQRVATAGGPGIEVISEVKQATVTEGRVTALYSKAAKRAKAGALKAGAGAGARKGPPTGDAPVASLKRPRQGGGTTRGSTSAPSPKSPAPTSNTAPSSQPSPSTGRAAPSGEAPGNVPGSSTAPGEGDPGATLAANQYDPGKWTVDAKELKPKSMPVDSRSYQSQVTHHGPGEVYIVKNVKKPDGTLTDLKFDGFVPGKEFQECKGPGYDQFLDKKRPGRFMWWFERSQKAEGGMVPQAKMQVRAAGGRLPVRWYVAEQKAADAIRELLERNGAKEVEVIYQPFLPPKGTQ